jgi:excisionase family DNA binding protein
MDVQVQKMAYGIAEVAALVGVCADTLKREIRAGKLKHKRLGRRIVIYRKWVDEYLESPDTWESGDAPKGRSF